MTRTDERHWDRSWKDDIIVGFLAAVTIVWVLALGVATYVLVSALLSRGVTFK